MTRRIAGALFVSLFFLGLILFAFGAFDPPRADAESVESRTPVVVELFTSQGCSSCPPADALLRELAEQPIDGVEIIPLSWHVDYWNRLGWTDPYSSEAATERQEMYARQLNARGLYTPQMVVDGRVEFVGSDSRRARAAIKNAADDSTLSLTIAVERDGDSYDVRVAAPSGSDPGDWTMVAALTAADVRTDVERGENSGRALRHTAVVLGSVELTPSDEHAWSESMNVDAAGVPDTAVVLAQDGAGRIVGIGTIEINGGS